ncbi:CUE domain-containing protein 3 [Termitomyces sp. T112]|nr:CUE domain-containing protein 3 [Termitomyces sp. T112]
MMGNDMIRRLPAYPSTTARKSLSPTQLATVNQTISSALLQTIALPPSKRDSPAARAFVTSYAKDTALQTLQNLIWQSGSTSKDERIIRKRTLILAEKIAPVLETQTLLDLAIIYAQTNESKIGPIFQEALRSNPVLVQSVETDFVPALTYLFNPSQGLYAIRKTAHCTVSFLRASPPELVRCFSHNQAFILALATLYDQGLGSIAQSYGGLSTLRNPNPASSTVDEWEPIWVQTKVDLVDAFHIIITSLLNDISTASGRALAAHSERAFGIIFALLELPSSSSTASSTSLTPFFNRSLLADYQESYSLSKTLSNALRNAAEKDERLDLLESMLQSLESSPPDKSTRRKDAGALKILIRSSGIAPGIDNRGDGGRLRSTQGLVDTTSRKGKGKATQPTLVAPSLATSSLGSTSSVPDIDIKITQVLDIFPDHAPNYVRALLEYATFGGDPEKVVMALLDGSAPSSEDLESMAAATAISDADDVGRFVNERKNVFDDEIMDVSKLRVGKAKEDASHVLRDRSFIEQMKADILRRAEAISDEEEEEVFPSSKPRGADYAFDEEEDTGPSGIKVAGDGEESNDSETDNDDVQDVERPPKSLDAETILELAYIKDPKLFDRDAQTRRSKARADLKMQTNWTDEQIEGWRIMLDKNPRKDRILQKHEFAGNHHETPLVTIASSSGGPLGGVRGRGGGGGGKGRSGTGSRGGRGGSTGGGADSARERAWKDKNKASRANHNRKKGHDKKMARAGAGTPPS